MANTTYREYGWIGAYVHSLLKAICFEPDTLTQCSHVIHEDYFATDVEKLFVRTALRFNMAHGRGPTRQEFIQNLRIELRKQGTLKDKAKELLAEIKKASVNKDDVIGHAVKFGAHMAMQIALLESVQHHHQGNYSEIVTLINSAVDATKLTIPNTDPTLSADVLEQPRLTRVVQTGVTNLDEVIGGLGNKEAGIVQAPSGVGKSFFLVQCACSAIRQGRHIYHLSLEMSTADVVYRYYANIAGLMLGSLPPNEDAKQKAFTTFKKTVTDHGAKLIVSGFEGHNISAADYLANVRRLVREGRLDADKLFVILDYPKLFKPNPGKYYKAQWERVYDAYLAAVESARIMNCPVWSAMQTNREGLKLERNDMSEAGGAYDAVTDAHVILTLNQSLEEKARKTMRIFVAKSRSTESRMEVPVSFDPAYSRFRSRTVETDTESVKSAAEAARKSREKRHAK